MGSTNNRRNFMVVVGQILLVSKDGNGVTEFVADVFVLWIFDESF